MEKRELRAELRQKRDSIDAERKKQLDRAIVQRIADSREFRCAKTILLYAPHGSEINLLSLVRYAHKLGKTVAFPRCNTETCTIQFFVLEPNQRLVRGAYGIAEPAPDAPFCQTDAQTLCILPGLSFDKRGNRIGYGKGYYDRFLESFEGTTIGAVYDELLSDEIPTEDHDLPVQIVFTESARYDCEKSNTTGMLGKAKSLAQRFFGSPKIGPIAPPLLVACSFLLLIISRLIDTHLTNRNNELIVVILLQIMIFVIPSIIYGKLQKNRLNKRLRLNPIHRRHVWFVLCVWIVMISGGLLLCILTGGIESLTGKFTLYDTFVAHTKGSFLEIASIVLAYCLLPAFCEELLYRSLLCAEYEKFGAPIAITVSALFFAMLHFSYALFPAYLFLGTVLAAVLYATRSFLAVFLLHTLYNLFCLFGQPYLSAFYVNAGNHKTFVFCLITLFLLFSAFAVGEARKIYHRYAKEKDEPSYPQIISVKEYPKQLLAAIWSPTAAVCAAIFLIMATVNLFI